MLVINNAVPELMHQRTSTNDLQITLHSNDLLLEVLFIKLLISWY